jgi:long-subunit acyl-CoA synthetase (AMP-forming)
MNDSFIDILLLNSLRENSKTSTPVQRASLNYAFILKNDFKIGNGDVVVSILKPGTNWNAIEYSIFLNNSIHAPISLRDSLIDTIDKIIFLNPKLIITDSATLKSSLEKKLSKSFSITTISNLETNNSSTHNFNEIDFASTGVILNTSGTSHKPKYVFLSLENMSVSFKEFANSGIFNGVKSYLELLPYSFSGGRKVNYSAQLNNLDITYQNRTKSLIENLKLSNADITACVPYMLKEILTHLENNGNNLKIKRIISGGAPITAKLINFFDSHGIKIYNVYGLTETASLCSYNNDVYYKANSVGKISRNIKFKINQNKELLLKGDNISEGYVVQTNPIKLKKITGFFNTKDIVEIDSEGFLYLKGRNNRSIKNSKGELVFINHIEKTLKEHFKIEIFEMRICRNILFIYSNLNHNLCDINAITDKIYSFNLSIENAYLVHVNDLYEIPKGYDHKLNLNTFKII